MLQSKRHSIYEAVTSTAIGFVVAYLLNLLVMHLVMGVQPTAGQNAIMVTLFTIVSVIRGYYVRRLFNWLGWRKMNKEETCLKT